LAEPQDTEIALETQIGQRVHALNQRTQKRLRRCLQEMSPNQFEALIGELLIAIGFDETTLKATRNEGDRDIEMHGTLRAGGVTEIKATVQAKRRKRNVRAPSVRELRSSLNAREQGIIITTSDFSKPACKEAQEAGKRPIGLIDGEQMLELLIQHEIGVTAEQHTVLALDEAWWGEMAPAEETAPLALEPARASQPVVSYPLLVRLKKGDQIFEAEMLDSRGRMRYWGIEYRSPSGAGQAATGWKSCNGWKLWRFRDAETGEWRLIDELR
jgi:restriction system protein